MPSSGSGCQSRGAKRAVLESRRQPGIELVQRIRAGGNCQPRRIDLDEQRLSAEADEGRAQRIVAGVAEDDEARAAQQFGTTLDEDVAPAMGAQALPQVGCRAGDDHAAFVELRQGVTQGTPRRIARRTGRQERFAMPSIHHRLAAREGQPDQGVEQVVAVVGTRGDFTAAPGALFIALPIVARRNEAQRRAISGAYAARGGGVIQRREIGNAVLQPGCEESA
jgi:hypothetical protein